MDQNLCGTALVGDIAASTDSYGYNMYGIIEKYKILAASIPQIDGSYGLKLHRLNGKWRLSRKFTIGFKG